MLRFISILLLAACSMNVAFAQDSDQDSGSSNNDGFASVDRSVPHPPTSVTNAGPGGVEFILDDGTQETAIGDGQPFVWLNNFTPAAGEYPFRLDQVQIFWASTYMETGDDFSLYIYQDEDGDPSNGMDLVSSYVMTVGVVDDFDFYDLPDGPILEGPGDFAIAVVNRFAATGVNDFPAAIDTTATQARSWAGSYTGAVSDPPEIPSDNGFDLIDNFGFPGNWMIRATGTRVNLVPTLGEWGMGALIVLLLGASLVIIRKRRA